MTGFLFSVGKTHYVSVTTHKVSVDFHMAAFSGLKNVKTVLKLSSSVLQHLRCPHLAATFAPSGSSRLEAAIFCTQWREQ
jgi:hypothetical protein